MDAPYPGKPEIYRRVALQLLETSTSRDDLRTVLGFTTASDTAHLDSILDWLVQRDLITAAWEDTDLRHNLTPTGEARARLSRTLGPRTLTGLEVNQVTVLRVLVGEHASPENPVNLIARFGTHIGADLEAVARGLAREGFVGNSVQRFDPGSNQPPQWYITADGLELMRILDLLPASTES